MPKLTNKQAEFVNQYFICGRNGTEAVIAAGYKCKDRAVAATIATENLRKPQIREAIDARMRESAMSAAEVLYLLSEHARGTFDDVLDARGRLDVGRLRDRGKMHLIKKWKMRRIVAEQSEIIETEVELHDAQSALVHLGRFHKLFTDKVEVLDWRGEAVQAIRKNEIDYVAIAEELGDDLASQLFREAGVPIPR